jgi:hypothetical protein
MDEPIGTVEFVGRLINPDGFRIKKECTFAAQPSDLKRQDTKSLKTS